MTNVSNIFRKFVCYARGICFTPIDRASIAKRYLRGNGIEIGALHCPLPVPQVAKVRYVDRLSIPELRKQYPELKSCTLVDPDIICDGEGLESIQDSTQDFVIANHFLEHCQNPIKAIRNMLRVLKKGGILYMVIPDQRHTFDKERPLTPIEHILKDYAEGPEWSKRQHFEEWVRGVKKIHDEAEVKKSVIRLMSIDYSIHYHVWNSFEMFEFFITLKKKLNFAFEIELFFMNITEGIFILMNLRA